MKKSKFGRVIAFVLALTMAVSCFAVTALAAEHLNADGKPADMQPEIPAFKVAGSFYQINADGTTVNFAKSDADGTWTAVPAAYIKGESPYNDGTEYAAYVVNGEVKFVPVAECREEQDGSLNFVHGTQDSAVVSSDVDTALAGDFGDDGVKNDNDLGTDFYLNIENGIDPDGMTVEGHKIAATDDGRISYDITVQTKTTYQLKATVPMYVCMYGYRGTGTVVTPNSDAYQLKNYSTIKNDESATIVDIVKLTTFTQVLDQDHSDENIYAVAYKEGEEADGSTDSGSANGEYKWFYSPLDADALNDLTGWAVYKNEDGSKLDLNASGECYIFCDGQNFIVKSAGVLDGAVLRETVAKGTDITNELTEAFVFNDFTFKEVAVGKQGTLENDATVSGLAIQVSEIQATPATWKLVPVSTGITEIKRGELAMSIAPSKATSDASAIDLASCSASVDITDRGWFLEAPTVQDGATEVVEDGATSLPLITSARMAGGNVNAAGCTQVVKVVYTVTPMVVMDNGTVATSNRA